jgi:DNA-binding response OmpR family regulator
VTVQLLIVDDDRTMLDLLLRVLAHPNWSICVAHGGFAALDELARMTYDVVVSDLESTVERCWPSRVSVHHKRFASASPAPTSAQTISMPW